MNLEIVKQKIAAAQQHENMYHGLTVALKRIATAQGAAPTEQVLVMAHAAVMKYIESVPQLLDHAYTQAKKEGTLDNIGPVFDAISNYFAQDFDIIPDQLGMVGLCDDAYLAHSLMEHVSSDYNKKTGRPLLAHDISAINQWIRGLIGEPHATLLDGIVKTTLNGPDLQKVIQQLVGMQRFQPVTWNTPDPIYGNASVEEIAKTRLGTMGIF